MDLIIAVEDPNASDVRALLDRHLTFARDQSPSEHVHARTPRPRPTLTSLCSAPAVTAPSWASAPSDGWMTPTPS